MHTVIPVMLTRKQTNNPRMCLEMDYLIPYSQPCMNATYVCLVWKQFFTWHQQPQEYMPFSVQYGLLTLSRHGLLNRLREGRISHSLLTLDCYVISYIARKIISKNVKGCRDGMPKSIQTRYV